MAKNSPLVCIAILNWNGGKVTLNCLKTLRITKYPNYKVMVLDNGSTDGSNEKIKSEFPEVDLIESKVNLGYTGGMNSIWKYSLKKYQPKYMCNMNNDILTVQKDWLRLMVNELEKSEKRGICGNKLTFPDGRLQLLFLDRQPKDYNEKDSGQYDFVKEVTAVGGANMLVKENVIKKIGGSDENFFYGPDDIDYCLRAKSAGFEIIYNGFSHSVHIGSFSYLSAKKDWIYGHQSYGQMILSFRHDNLKGKFLMIIRQLVRAFLTRKDPFKKKTLSNLLFHKRCIPRLFIFPKSLFSALKNYKNVKNIHLK